LELRLNRRKAVLRQFTAAARRMYCSYIVLNSVLNNLHTDFYKNTGRTPWTGIAEDPSAYITKRSRADTDHQLQEPSHMKSDGIDAWLRHWLKIQKRNKRPLVFKEGSDATQSNPTTASKGKAKASKAPSVDDDDSDDEANEGHTSPTAASKGKAKASKTPSIDKGNSDDKADEVHTNPTTASKGKAKASKTPSINDGNSDDKAVDEDSNNGPSTTEANRLPLTPLSASKTRKTRRAFLATLSDDSNYQKLLLLLHAAKVNHML